MKTIEIPYHGGIPVSQPCNIYSLGPSKFFSRTSKSLAVQRASWDVLKGWFTRKYTSTVVEERILKSSGNVYVHICLTYGIYGMMNRKIKVYRADLYATIIEDCSDSEVRDHSNGLTLNLSPF